MSNATAARPFIGHDFSHQAVLVHVSVEPG
jgi:hypothetical protein